MGQDRTFSAGGGGGSFVTRSPHNTTTAIVVVAGGGGAPSQDYSGISATVASWESSISNQALVSVMEMVAYLSPVILVEVVEVSSPMVKMVALVMEDNLM